MVFFFYKTVTVILIIKTKVCICSKLYFRKPKLSQGTGLMDK